MRAYQYSQPIGQFKSNRVAEASILGVGGSRPPDFGKGGRGVAGVVGVVDGS